MHFFMGQYRAMAKASKAAKKKPARKPASKTASDSTPAARRKLAGESDDVCKSCEGSGKAVKIGPELLDGVTQEDIGIGSGVSPTLICRMFSENPNVQRRNPKLETLKGMREYFSKLAGRHVSFDALIELLDD
jgi:hypothetical protein